MNGLTPLIELASRRNLDLFFRAGQGYLAQSLGVPGQMQAGYGLSPLGVQARAEARIVCAVAGVPHGLQPYARPGG